MHPEADALLNAIWDNPNDDTARLVYADWLQENGHEDYAQFIRLSVLIARQSLPPDERSRLRRERYLLGEQIGKCHPFASQGVVGSKHSLGIPDFHFGTEAASFLKNWPEWWPFIAPRSLSLFYLHGLEDKVAGCQYLRRLDALACSGKTDMGFYEHREEEDWRPISGSLLTALGLQTGLDRLCALIIEPIRVTAEELLTFAKTPLAHQLEDLRLWVEFADGSRQDLRNPPHFVKHEIHRFVAEHGSKLSVS